MKEDSQDRQLAMATKTPPLKRIRAFSNSFKIISARLKSQMLVNCPGVEFFRTIPKLPWVPETFLARFPVSVESL